MSENELTITRALAELTTLRKRINKLTTSTTFVGTKTTGQAWKDFQPEAKSNWQAIADLQTRYSRIKFAIISSNAVTKVTICGNVMTVAEAIVMKECMKTQELLLDELRQQRQNTTMQVENHERNIQRQLDKLMEGLCKNQEGNRDENQIKAVSETYRKNNKIEIVDPVHIDKEIERLDKEVDNFKSEVDFVLSESNALTKITV